MGWDGMGWDGMGLSHPTRSPGTQMYLDERTQYRETGIVRKPIKRPYYINPQKEMERISKIRKEYERLEHKDN
jgi:hypothetical protein